MPAFSAGIEASYVVRLVRPGPRQIKGSGYFDGGVCLTHSARTSARFAWQCQSALLGGCDWTPSAQYTPIMTAAMIAASAIHSNCLITPANFSSRPLTIFLEARTKSNNPIWRREPPNG